MKPKAISTTPESADLTDGRQGLIVLGMHRSGTSALTGALNRCGVWLGSEFDLTGANRENPKGFFERKDVRAVCDALLRSVDSDWWKIAEFRIEAIPQGDLIKCGRAFQEVIAKLGRQSSTWAIKEPRLCLLFPALQSYIPHPVCILMHRNPLEVARSLRVRNGFGLAEGLALWEAYNLYALRASQGFRRVLISYEELRSAPSDAVARLFQKLAHKYDVKLTGVDIQAVNDFISPELHRQQSDAHDTEVFLTPSQQTLWRQLQNGEALEFDNLHDLPQAAREILSDLEARKHYQDQLHNRKNRFGQLSIHTRGGEEVEDRLLELRTKLASSDARVAALHSSMSWRVTTPLRMLSFSVRRTIDYVANFLPSRVGALTRRSRVSSRCAGVRGSQRIGEKD